MSEPYVDRPRPGREFLVLWGALGALFAAVGTVWMVHEVLDHEWRYVCYAVGWSAGASVIFAGGLYAMFHLEYFIDDEMLVARLPGSTFRTRLDEVRRVGRGGRSIARWTLASPVWTNRLGNAIEIEVPNSWRGYIACTPTDVDEFIAELERRAGRKLLDEG